MSKGKQPRPPAKVPNDRLSGKRLDYNVERKYTEGTLTADEISRSDDLKEMFPAYLNSLKLKDKNGKTLTLDKNGNGSFKEQIKKYYIDSANTALTH